MFVTRICYNTLGWTRPTGEARKLESSSFSTQYGFGTEEWLFRDEWMLDGWHYSHVRGVDDSRMKLIKRGTPFDLVLFTIDPDKRRRFVALLRNAECLDDEQARAVLEQYRSNGWWDSMRTEVEAIDAEARFFDEDRPPHSLFNLRHRLEQVEYFPPGTFDGPGHDILSSARYKLIDLRDRPLPASSPVPRVSALRIERALDMFQASEIREQGKPLVTFRDPTTRAYEWEDYKPRVAIVGLDKMDARGWRKKDIGTGTILDSVIAAIEHKDNNLVTWDGRFGDSGGQHAALLDARGDRELTRSLEAVFFEMYKRGIAGREQFDKLIELCRKPYALIAFLFFLVDRERNLPIRPKRIGRVFEFLGLDLRLTGDISWEHYQAYLRRMALVRDALRRHGIFDATLLDAHSFCWILSYEDLDHAPVLRKVIQRESQITVIPPERKERTQPVESCVWVDLDADHQRRVRAGKKAEDIVFRHERERLTEAGRADLAKQVRDVSDYPAFGYDIQSFESNGDKRCIEVKNVTNGNRFYVTENEWQKSRGEPNYWFYLVSKADTPEPVVDPLDAKQLTEDDLLPVQWQVHFKRSE